ncbi:hypothetical protein L228DRAFT_168635 [Xylona heveae TC161]|uniref:Uncharacterized protein n=1 Tax=Xylona heveae (strain CBS 132557 / TC161) TaxID=1328760 RepID=A0A165FPP7_XYLHT|nr:hypothetical protein L228DRAFT_168635 [Xylona heveae TC161]KZF21234.1 hypothetical protein L228DRAFT_168635 [Xylona heveae TC161]
MPFFSYTSPVCCIAITMPINVNKVWLLSTCHSYLCTLYFVLLIRCRRPRPWDVAQRALVVP